MSDPAKDDGRSIAFECDLAEPPEKVWRALTTPEIMSEWLLPTDLERAEAGAAFIFRDPAAPDAPIECEVLSVEAGRSIDFRWRDGEARRDGLDSTVRFEIAPAGAGGTRLRIVHEVRRAGVTALSTSVQRATAARAVNDNRLPLRMAA